MLVEYLYYYDNGESPTYARREYKKPESHIEYCNLQARARSRVVAFDHFGVGLFDDETGEFYIFGEMNEKTRKEIDKMSGIPDKKEV